MISVYVGISVTGDNNHGLALHTFCNPSKQIDASCIRPLKIIEKDYKRILSGTEA